MDVRAYELFLRLAETRHFGRTARLCNLSPSAVSRQLQRLEAQVGQHLVDRDNRQVHLTPAGRHFLDYARKAVADWQQVRSDLTAGPSALVGEISVFASVTASFSMLAQILPRMRAAYPGIEIKLRTGDQADGIERVSAGSEDCAIIARPDRLAPRLRFLPLRQTPLRMIGPEPPSALGRELADHAESMSELNWHEVPWVLAERGLARERLLARFDAIGKSPSLYAQVAGHEAVVSMVSLGFGVAVVPELVIDHSPRDAVVRVLPWFDDLPPFELGLCTLAEQENDPLLRALWACAGSAYPQPN